MAVLPTAIAGNSLPLVDLGDPGVAGCCAPTSDQVSFKLDCDAAVPGLAVGIAPGTASYPGLAIKPLGEGWDLSGFGHIEARIVNTGTTAVGVNVRADNAGGQEKDPWNTERVHIPPGETATAKVIFGYQYGLKPGFKLDASEVVQVLFFTGKVTEAVSFRIESIRAAGPAGERPPVNPRDVRIAPLDGHLLGGAVVIDFATQIKTKDGAVAEVVTRDGRQMLRLNCSAKRNSHQVLVQPPIGRWDLTEATEIRVRVVNVGASPVTPGVQVTSDRHNGTDTVFARAALPPGKARDVVVPFAPAAVWLGPEGEVTKAHMKQQRGTGTSFASDKADAVKIIAKHGGEAALLIESIVAVAVSEEVPSWVGKRPPVDGKWTMTFEDEFDGSTIDRGRWNIYTENYWDKRSHFTKDNVVMGEGMVRLRMEKKTGHENDDPGRKQTDYAVGFLDTYGKWAQRYGYFEARMKLPTAPGLWPAFWMMPDRGPGLGRQWKRASTGEGAMEFDIMEHLTRWGQYRYNIAMHWDGYGKEHKSIGTSNVYIRPDSGGFITCGLLWTPGTAVYYCNGNVVAHWDNPRISTVQAYPILYMVTGGWDNSPVDDAQLPADFLIDYVRIWQRQDLASDLDGEIADLDESQPGPNAPPPSGVILATADGVDPVRIQMEGATVAVVEHDGVKVLQAEFSAENTYPGFVFPVAENGWNLSAFAGVQVDVMNTGRRAITVVLRVDNEGHWSKSPWNVESVTLEPGELKTIKVTFGKSNGGKRGFALNPARVVAFRTFAADPKQPGSFLVSGLRAFGTPSE